MIYRFRIIRGKYCAISRLPSFHAREVIVELEYLFYMQLETICIINLGNGRVVYKNLSVKHFTREFPRKLVRFMSMKQTEMG